jgi:ADP-ribose pyrophosphatase YjhB (NUDIX family)
MILTRWLNKLARLYWKVRKPVTMGSRAIIIQNGRVLLVRLSYREGWYLPGGGVKKGESFQSAITREIAEECGLEVAHPKLLQIYTSQLESKIDYIALFEISDFQSLPHAKPNAEIIEVCFFSIYDLPEDTSPATRRRIKEYCINDYSNERW